MEESLFSKDLLQYIAQFADDREALIILTSNKKLNTDYYFQIVFGNRYPDLLKYFKNPNLSSFSSKYKDTSIRYFYLRMLKEIGYLREKYGYIYKSGDLFKQSRLVIQRSTGGMINELLLEGIKENSKELVDYAVQKGANINSNAGRPLNRAIEYAYLEMVKHLVQHGADVHISNDFPLKYAKTKVDEDIVNYLESL